MFGESVFGKLQLIAGSSTTVQTSSREKQAHHTSLYEMAGGTKGKHRAAGDCAAY